MELLVIRITEEMKMNTQDIESAVNSIEQDIFESSNCAEYLNMVLKTNGFVKTVEFAGIRLWDSETDERDYIDESNEDTREPIEDHLRRVLRNELAKLKTIVV